MVIKRLKSILDIDELRAKEGSALAEVWLNGKLLYALLLEKRLRRKLGIDGILCVAVMAFLDEQHIFREFCRVVRPGGCVLFSQRVDLFEKREYQAIIDKLTQQWDSLYVSEPMLYLPGHEAYQDRIKVQYFAFRVK